jgi:transcriptional regulator with XRE-family HTH domain
MATQQRGILLPSLRTWRLRRLLNQRELAERAHVGRSTIIRAESGGTVSIANARRIVEALGVDPEQLLLREDLDRKSKLKGAA